MVMIPRVQPPHHTGNDMHTHQRSIGAGAKSLQLATGPMAEFQTAGQTEGEAGGSTEHFELLFDQD